MHERHNAQKQHIIYSLDTLLFQLHTLSFFLSPSLLGFISRLFSQFQCSRPRDIDPSRSLRFWYFMLLFFNIGCIWTHATEGAAEGRTVVLDFVGQAHMPSKKHLLLLDALILFLQMLLTTIAYETSLLSKSAYVTPPIPTLSSPFQTPSASPSPPLDDPSKSSLPPPTTTESPYIIDIRLRHVLERLRKPAPTVPESNSDDLLPFPNTTPWPLPASLRMLLRARAEVRRRARVQTQPAAENTETTTRVPGEMDADDSG